MGVGVGENQRNDCIEMKYAIVDLGTNSVRFDVHEVLDSGMRRRLYRDKVMVRLGEKVFQTSQLQKEAMDRTIEALAAFQKKSKELGVDKTLAVATSAVRDANNREAFLKRAKVETELHIEVISGIEEATLILEGIRANDAMATDSFGFIDIGGGSTEIGISNSEETLFLESYPLGSARLEQMFFSKKTSLKNVLKMRDYIQKELQKLKGKKDFPSLEFAIGSSGTIKALAKIMRKESGGRKISRKRLRTLINLMLPMSREELLKLDGLEEKRVDLILAGAILLDETMNFLNIKKVFHTRFALRDGLFSKALQSAII